MALSLAALRYRAAAAGRGGPIAALVDGPGTLWDGRPCREAFATLVPALRRPAPRSLYGDADGQGTAATRAEACHRAVSEALERWAFYAASESPDRARWGFDVEPSTTGMAAFPGLTRSGARSLARLEAVERWSVLEWWRGNLPSRRHEGPGLPPGALEVLTPFARAAVAVVWTPPTGGRPAAYGFAAAPDFRRAAAKAGVELSRNARALASAGAATASGPQERRLVYFSGLEGFAHFEARAAAAEGLGPTPPAAPKALIDAELPGPWSRYATVWRVLWRHREGPDRDSADETVFRF